MRLQHFLKLISEIKNENGFNSISNMLSSSIIPNVAVVMKYLCFVCPHHFARVIHPTAHSTQTIPYGNVVESMDERALEFLQSKQGSNQWRLKYLTTKLSRRKQIFC